MLIWGCAVWFIFLCLVHYLSLRPLWLDENLILESIKNIKTIQIFGPLDNCQYFPRVYLMLIKELSQRFNYHVLSLRFLPLVVMISGFLIWLRIYRNEFSDKWISLLAIFSFVSSYYLSYYASEFKHYSMDVFTIAIFYLYLIYQKEYIYKAPTRKFIIATVLLPLAMLFSYSSFFVFWIAIYNFLFMIRRNPKLLSPLIIYVSLAFLIIFSIYHFDIKYTLSAKVPFSFWNDYFLCTKSPYCFLKSFGEGLRKLVVWWFGNSILFRRAASPLIPFFAVSLFVYGLKSLRENKLKLWGLDSLGLVIFSELFILGVLRKYPFTGARTSLFFAPFVFYFIVKGIHSFRKYRPLFIGFVIFYTSFLFLCSLNSFLTYWKLYD